MRGSLIGFWELPKNVVPLGVPITRAIVFGGLYWGPSRKFSHKAGANIKKGCSFSFDPLQYMQDSLCFFPMAGHLQALG